MIFSKIKKILYPADHACIACGRRGRVRPENGNAVICDECLETFTKVTAPVCVKCGRRLGAEDSYCEMCAKHEFLFEKAASVYVYDGKVKDVVHKLKYSGEPWIADFAAEEMKKKYEELSWECDVVTYVPMYWIKERKRGYNQAELLAGKLAKACGLECVPLLRRVKNTTPQSFLDKNERMKNIENAFELDPEFREYVKGKTVLATDDILTTGSSLNECAKVLIEAGAGKVYGLCMCSVDGIRKE